MRYYSWGSSCTEVYDEIPGAHPISVQLGSKLTPPTLRSMSIVGKWTSGIHLGIQGTLIHLAEPFSILASCGAGNIAAHAA